MAIVHVHVHVSEALKARLDAEAQRQKRSLRVIVELALEQYFQTVDDKALPRHPRHFLRSH